MLKLLRYLLFPIVPIYYVVTWFRNKLYDFGIKKSVAYKLPVIAVGNLSVGGTGKTPMIEYLIRLLQSQNRLATLSRGYKRQSKGFVLADENASAKSLGDEPFQFYKKFKNIRVSVDADRVHGISKLISLPNPPEVILLDDAFQHRKVKAGFYILLTAYDNLYFKDIVLPTGNLREPGSGAQRADVIIVTKCPTDLSEERKLEIVKRINPKAHQRVFFAQIAYAPYVINEHQKINLEDLIDNKFTLVTGIANPDPLVKHLKNLGLQFEHLNFKDHHEFSSDEIKMLQEKPLIITTEKDMVRLQSSFDDAKQPLYLPIEMKIDGHQEFDALISKFVK